MTKKTSSKKTPKKRAAPKKATQSNLKPEHFVYYDVRADGTVDVRYSNSSDLDSLSSLTDRETQIPAGPQPPEAEEQPKTSKAVLDFSYGGCPDLYLATEGGKQIEIRTNVSGDNPKGKLAAVLTDTGNGYVFIDADGPEYRIGYWLMDLLLKSLQISQEMGKNVRLPDGPFIVGEHFQLGGLSQALKSLRD